MKCIICKNREAKGNTELCDPCRLKKWRKDNPVKVRAYAKMRYKRDKVKILEKVREYNKRTNYAYFKSGKPKERNLIRRKTRHKYPLEGNNCQFCSNPAEHRHHTTEPIEIDKFIFLCKKCHDEFHDDINEVDNEK